jgi:hypothetical protein
MMLILMALLPVGAMSQGLRKFVLDEQRIEGKIRRPQLVLIRADQRPEFVPMVMQSFGRKANIVSFVDQGVIESDPHQGAFVLEGKAVTNYTP